MILASGSPRRRELLQDSMGFKDLVVVKSAFDENLGYDSYSSAEEYCLATCIAKGNEILTRPVQSFRVQGASKEVRELKLKQGSK